MDFFNSLIVEVNNLIDCLKRKSFSYEKSDAWQDIGYNEVILQRDTAAEASTLLPPVQLMMRLLL